MKGGFKNKLKAQGFPLAKVEHKRNLPPTTSLLAKNLLEQWSWGRMSLPTLQRLAAAAVHDGLEDEVLRFS